MEKLMGWLGVVLGGWIGWEVGLWASLTLAFVLSIVGSGVGLYLARRIVRDHF